MKIIRDTEKSERNFILKNLFKEHFEGMTLREFQAQNGLKPDGLFGLKTYEVLYNKILKVKSVPFNSYFTQKHIKNTIVLHYSASGDSAENMFDHWNKDDGYVSVPIGISHDGTIVKAYDEGFWGYHLGLKHYKNVERNKESVAVEIMNWGYLSKKKDVYLTYKDKEVKPENVEFLNFRGQKYWEKYKPEQIESLKNWILLNALRFEIPLDFTPAHFEYDADLIQKGKRGIFTHCSYRKDKFDITPLKDLTKMLYGLKKYETWG